MIPELGFSHYRQKSVREGGMAYVYICEAKDLGERLFAIKRLKPDFARHPDTSTRFLRECFIWMSLGGHPNTVQARSAHMAPLEPPAVVLEYVEKSLRDHLPAEPMDSREALRMAINVCDGLQHACLKIPGFVHRDIKPENVMVDENGVAKLTDFGLSKVAEEAPKPDLGNLRVDLSSTKTGVGHIMGTPFYMAPEQLRGEAAGPPCDVYAIGRLLFEATVSGNAVLSLGRIVPGGSFEDLADLYPERSTQLHPALVRVITQALAPNPADRLGDASSLRRELASVLAEIYGESIEEPGSTEPEFSQIYGAAKGLSNLFFDEEALRAFEECLKTAEGEFRPLVLLEIARTKLNLRDPVGAQDVLDSIDIDSVSEPTIRSYYRLVIAQIAYSRDDWVAAKASLQLAVEEDDTASITWFELAKACARTGDKEGMLHSLDKALSISPNLMYFMMGATELVNTFKDLNSALHTLDLAKLRHPNSPEPFAFFALVACAIMTQRIGQQDISVSTLRRLFEDTVEAMDRAMELGTDPSTFRECPVILGHIARLVGFSE